jgi:hypothetical protein
MSTAFGIFASSGIFALDPGLDDIGSTTDPRRQMNGLGGAIHHAGAAFHAAV